MDRFEFMEVDDNHFQEQGLPRLDILKRPASSEKITLFSSQTQSPPNHEKEQILLPDHGALRRQQTHEPVCPQEFSLVAGAFDDGAAGAPGLEGFDALPDPEPPIPQLTADDVEAVLNPFIILPVAASQQREPTAGDFGEAFEAPSAPSVPLLQGQDLFLAHHNRQSRQTISLMVSPKEEESVSWGCPSIDDPEDGLEHIIIHELMDDDNCESSGSAACDLSMASACESPSAISEHRQYGDTAKYILELHQRLSKDIPQAKKKPMLHEFLGYILFRSAEDANLASLRNAMHFCDEEGRRAEIAQPRAYFRVSNFQVVSEVWRQIKCNSSRDCTKNMKRAMRMSTTNERQYFVNLSHKMHRMQVFRFGERSVEHFKRLFPSAYQ